MRKGNSTVALLCGQPVRRVSYDINPFDDRDRIDAMRGRTSFQFHCADVLTVDIEPTDLLFIDTLHTYGQLRAELTRHSDAVRNWIIVHDTETFGVNGEHGERGIMPAIEEFDSAGAFRITERFANNHGLIVMERT